MAQLNFKNLEKRKITSYDMPKGLKEPIRQVIYFMIGAVISRGMVFEKYSPFGPAMLSSIPYKNCGAFLIGEILGYILPSSISQNVAYIAASIAIASIRWALNDLENIKSSNLFAPIITVVSVCAMSAVMSLAHNFNLDTVLFILTDSLIALISAFFFSRTTSLVSGKKKFKSLNEKELVFSIITACILIMSLSFFYIFNISFGKVLASFGILFFSYYLKITGGSIAGIALASAFCLASSSFSHISGAYTLSGIISGMISKFGKLITSIAFLLANLAFISQKQEFNNIINSTLEIVIGATFFFMISNESSEKFIKLLIRSENKTYNKEFSEIVSSRLNFVSKTIMKVSESLGQAWKKLYNLDKKESEEKEFEACVEKTCNKCNLKTLCWSEFESETINSFKNIRTNLYKNKNIKKENLGEAFQKRCLKIDELTANINILKNERIEKEIAKQKINEIEEIISKQFSYICEILSELSLEFEKTQNIDSALSEEIFELLKKEGALPIRAICKIDKKDRLMLEIETSSKSKTLFKNSSIKRNIERLCSKNFDTPSIETIDNKTRVLISEKPKYEVEIVHSQHVCKNRSLCGDNFQFFNSGTGKMIVILSDGMGTGGRAAIDSAITSGIVSKLVKSGVGFNLALKIANLAMISKSEDESLATVDALSIDLFTGNAKFLKAGAPFSLIKNKTKIKKIGLESLPIGIFNETNFVQKEEKLNEGDIVVMFSDGVIATDENLPEKELEILDNKEFSSSAEQIVDEAIKRQENGYDDDITALSLRLIINKGA